MRLRLWRGGKEMSVIVAAEYKTFLKEIKERIHKAQYDAFKSVNRELINLYWDIGKSIVAKQEKLSWGKSVVESLAKDLQKEFPGMQGFSSANLWRMRNFYIAYQKNEKLAPLVREISWTEKLPRDLKKYLPSPEDMIARIQLLQN
jgi:predicted nuclease of restriction endonuclease-like (RecB) superfamily